MNYIGGGEDTIQSRAAGVIVRQRENIAVLACDYLGLVLLSPKLKMFPLPSLLKQ